MPKKIDPALRERAVRLVREHRGEYSSTTAAAEAVARQLGVARESVRRRVAQAGQPMSRDEALSMRGARAMADIPEDRAPRGAA